MTVKTIKLKVHTPAGPIFPGRGFYQLEEDALYVQLAPFSREFRFFSYLESRQVRFDLNKAGQLLFIELSLARRHWLVDNNFFIPKGTIPADIRWLDFREKIHEPKITTNKNKTTVKISFTESPPVFNYIPASSLIVQTDDKLKLIAVYITEIVDDVAGREIAAFRNTVLKQLPLQDYKTA